MLCINSPFSDIYFNLAAEEYLLKNFSDNFFVLSQNEPSVVLGKFQDVNAEINRNFAEEKRVKIARRISGGGCVFQDSGNFNLSFIETGNNIRFEKFTNRILAFLSSQGIDTESQNQRGIFIKELKISGNAQYVYKDRVLYHATLLYSADLSSLADILEGKQTESEYSAQRRKYVKSVKSPVTNICKYLQNPLETEDFREVIFNYFLEETTGNKSYQLSGEDILAVNSLKSSKYTTSKWILNNRL